MPEQTFDLIVIGAGPGGYVAAIKAAQLGLNVACVEAQYLGGTCLNVGCIPSKALLDSSEKFYAATHTFAKQGIQVGSVVMDVPAMIKFKDDVVSKMTNGVGFLFKKNKVTHLKGHGTIAGKGVVEVKGADGTQRYQTQRILIATGSEPIQIPGFEFDEKTIMSSTGALAMSETPQHLVIVGGGYIGVEIGSVWARLGAKVTVLEFLDRILPASDTEMAAALQKFLVKQGIEFKFGVKAKSAKASGKGVKVEYEQDGKTLSIEADKVMVSVGRRPFTQNLGLESVGIKPNAKGFIEVDEHFRAVDGVWAIGDVIGRIMLAHNAEEEGVACVEQMAGQAGHVNYLACPAVVYTHPELASVGLTEEAAREKFGTENVRVGKFPFLANGRAVGMGEPDGFVKILGHAKNDRLLGAHILAAHASDVIAECVVAMEFAGNCEDLARSFHAHPTLPEAVKEAAMAASFGKPIHA